MSSLLKKWIGFASIAIVSLCILLAVVGGGNTQSAIAPTATVEPTATMESTATVEPTATTRPTSTRIPTATPVACGVYVGEWAREMSPVMELWADAMNAGGLGLWAVVADNSVRISAKLAFVTPPSCEPRAKQVQDLITVANEALQVAMIAASEGRTQDVQNAMALVMFSQEEALRILNTIVADYR